VYRCCSNEVQLQLNMVLICNVLANSASYIDAHMI
jgi:hypothetical protein